MCFDLRYFFSWLDIFDEENMKTHVKMRMRLLSRDLFIWFPDYHIMFADANRGIVMISIW